jgi:DNA (cytosine-5)-methyltransferase 1
MALTLWLGAGAVAVRWHSEIDPDASLVLKTHWPEVPNLGSFADEDFWERAERVHLMCGGIPCQPFSAAGRQLGEADPRHLWPFWRRGIELHRPPTIVFENVANLTRGKMRPTFDAIITDLLALGYDVRWCLLGACAVGAAHHRHRVFLLACRTRTAPNVRQVTVQTCGQGVAAYLPTPSAVSYGSNQGGGAGRVGPVRHSLDALARLELLRSPNARDGDGKRGQGSVEHMRRRLESGHMINLGDQVRLLDDDRENVQVASARADQCGQSFMDWGPYAAAVARHAGVVGTLPPEPTEVGPKGGRRLAAAFSEWLMMLPAGHLTDILGRNAALARAGNGVVPLQAATALRLLFEDLRS